MSVIFDEDVKVLNCIQELKQAVAGLSARVLALEKEAQEAKKADEELSEVLLEYWK